MQHFLPFQYCFCFRQLSEIFGSFALKCSTAIANELLTLELDHCYNLTCLERLKMKQNDLKKKTTCGHVRGHVSSKRDAGFQR